MTPPSFWLRLRSARIVQVLVVYLGASWAVLQIADLLTSALELPKWVVPVAVLLLLVGLVIIVATAWVQSHPATTQREQRGEVPADWQVAPADALASLRAGRVPHLTWGRAIAGGVVAIALLFGGALGYVVFRGEPAPGFRTAGVVADVAAEGIAVVPFEVRGQDLEIWREGMVDLLANNLDGVGGFRTIDARTIMARWKENVGDDATVDLDAALRAARATGARYALVGSVVSLGERVRLVSNVYDLDTRREVAQGQAEGATTDVLRLVDDLAVGTMRSLLRTTGRDGAGDIRAETLTTTSLPALREFLDGERHYRKGDFAEAVQSFERAVAADTTFAIGLVRLSEAYGWLENQNSEKMREYGERAVAHTDRLPPRYQFIMKAWDALNRGSAEGVPTLKQAVQKYPDDPEGWFLLAETYMHVQGPTAATIEDIEAALRRAIALDPNFAPYRVHEIDVAIMRGDRAAAEAAVERYTRLAGNDAGVQHALIAIPLLLGDSAEAVAAVEAAKKVDAHVLDVLLGTYEGWVDRLDRLEGVERVFADVGGSSRDAQIAWKRVSRGALASAAELAATLPNPANLGIFLGHQFEQWGTVGGPLAARLSPSLCAEPYNNGCYLFVGPALAGARRSSELDAVIRTVRQAAEAAKAEGNDPAAAARTATADIITGIGAWRRGDVARARVLLTPHVDANTLYGGRARLALAEIELEQKNWQQASHYAQGVVYSYARARALAIQARAWEGLGDLPRATAAWRHFVELTRTGDPDVPRIREAREALARIGG